MTERSEGAKWTVCEDLWSADVLWYLLSDMKNVQLKRKYRFQIYGGSKTRYLTSRMHFSALCDLNWY